MPQVIKYKVVRRGQKYCVRIKGVIDTLDVWHWFHERNINCLVKVRYDVGHTWADMIHYDMRWDYDLHFDKSTDATAFIIGYL